MDEVEESPHEICGSGEMIQIFTGSFLTFQLGSVQNPYNGLLQSLYK